MKGLSESQQVRRVIALVLLGVAFLSPWAYDTINVPAQYTCSPPNIRLEGDFCGMPLSGVFILYMIGQAFAGLTAELFAGESSLADRAREYFVLSLYLTLWFPLITTLGLILRNQSRTWTILNLVAWSLGLVIAGGMLILNGIMGVGALRHVWGIWLYLGVGLVMVVAEARGVVLNRRSGPPAEPPDLPRR